MAVGGERFGPPARGLRTWARARVRVRGRVRVRVRVRVYGWG